MYAITMQRHYYQGTLNADGRELLLGDDWTGSSEYPTRQAALAAADGLLGERYYLAHSEYAAPTFRAVKVGSKRYARLYRRTYGGADPR